MARKTVETGGEVGRERDVDRDLERVCKGFASHRRIQILRLVAAEPEITIGAICRRIRTGLKSGSEHIRRAHLGGLIGKRYEGREVHVRLSPLGEKVLRFLNSLL